MNARRKNHIRSDAATLFPQPVKEDSVNEAESISRNVLSKRRAVLGTDHPDTLASINRLSTLLLRKAEPDIAEAVQLIDLGLTSEASRLEHELNHGPSDATHKDAIEDTSRRDLALSTAITFDGAVNLGARALLISKGVAGEIDASLRRVAATEPSLSATAVELQHAEALLARMLQKSDPEAIEAQRLIRDELKRTLAGQSHDFSAAINFEILRPHAVTAALTPDALFLDFGIYRPVAIGSDEQSSEHLALAIYRRGTSVELHDLGPFSAIADDIDRLALLNELEVLPNCEISHSPGCPSENNVIKLNALLVSGNDDAPLSERVNSTIAGAKQRLADFLLGPLGSIRSNTQLIISPDGALHRLNFSLLAHRGRHLVETNELRIIPNGRVLVRGEPEQIPVNADLFAMGGGAYGDLPNGKAACDNRSLGLCVELGDDVKKAATYRGG